MKALKNTFRGLFLVLILGFASVLMAADIAVTPASVVADAGFGYQDVTAGATITAGQVVYIDTSGKAQLAKNDTAINAAARGIALHGSSSGQPLRIVTSGVINPGGTVTVGMSYWVSANAGGIAPTADVTSTKFVTALGVGTTTSKITLNIKAYGVQVP